MKKPGTSKGLSRHTPHSSANETEASREISATAEPLEGVVERKLDPMLQNLSRVQRDQVISTVVKVVQSETFSGTLPHPSHLERYEVLVPGIGERMMVSTERTLEHNLSSLKLSQKNDHRYRLLGMWLGFFALLLLVGSAVYVGLQGNNILSGMLLGTSVLSSIGVFVSAHISKPKESE